MLNILSILKGRVKQVVVHGPKKGESVTIELDNSSSVDVKAFGHLVNILYSKNRSYNLSPPEEIALYKDIKNSGIKNKKLSLAELDEYRAYIFNNKHKLAA